jgi:hypothetical protein
MRDKYNMARYSHVEWNGRAWYGTIIMQIGKMRMARSEIQQHTSMTRNQISKK